MTDRHYTVRWDAAGLAVTSRPTTGERAMYADNTMSRSGNGALPPGFPTEQQRVERAAFEEWALPILGDNSTWRESGPCELAWQAWKAAKRTTAPVTPPAAA